MDRPGEESGTVQLINVQTGAVIKTWTVNFNNGDTTFPSDGSSFSFTELSSDTQYRIVVTSPYHYDITTERYQSIYRQNGLHGFYRYLSEFCDL